MTLILPLGPYPGSVLSAMSDWDQTGIFQEANRTSENGAAQCSILQVCWEPLIVRQSNHLRSWYVFFSNRIQFCSDL